MSQEVLLRVALVVLAVALYVNHHVIDHGPATKSTMRLKGLDLWLVITTCLWTLSLALYALGFELFSLPLPWWLRWVGVVAMLACFPLSQWIYQELGVHFSKKLELRSDHQLIKSGPYHYVRHPMYATLFLCAAATCLITASVAVMLTTGAVAIVFLLRIRKEEMMLLVRFGDQYREYQRHTAALVPKLL